MARIPPLNSNSPIVDEKGQPKPEFVLLINQLLKIIIETASADAAQAIVDAAAALVAALAAQADAAAALAGLADKADKTTEIIAGVGLDGGGDLSADRTLDLADTAVTPDTYGDALNVPQITVDQQGRITGVVDVPITGGGSVGGILPVVDGEIPPNFIQMPDGNLVYMEVSA